MKTTTRKEKSRSAAQRIATAALLALCSFSLIGGGVSLQSCSDSEPQGFRMLDEKTRQRIKSELLPKLLQARKELIEAWTKVDQSQFRSYYPRWLLLVDEKESQFKLEYEDMVREFTAFEVGGDAYQEWVAGIEKLKDRFAQIVSLEWRAEKKAP